MDLGEGKSANTAAFADDTALITHTTNSMQAILDGPLKAFCNWTSMEINTDKTYITGIDFDNGQEICTSDVTWEGNPLNSVPPTQAIKYLGVHIRLDGHWEKEKHYVLTKLRSATQHLRAANLSRKQTMAYLSMAVYPIFRYSACFVTWSDTELQAIDKLFVSCVKAAYGVSQLASSAPFMLSLVSTGAPR